MAEVNSLVISVFIEQKIKKIVQEYVKLHPHNTWNNSIKKCKAFSDFLANSQKGWTQRKFISDRRVSPPPLRCPEEALTQPLSALFAVSYNTCPSV